ncbi:MAG: RdgB/HAM1 family non-canonical purine NTP pyrophosphatase [Bacteroidia bacterium]|nr:RdgB/HAM1 family non-canonical purine NTP pyrophosphatase [Bacteroidia bacterium]
MNEEKLLFGTFNRHKFTEAAAILAPTTLVCAADLPHLHEPEETGDTLEQNAALKARHYHRLTGLPCFADDTGLEVAALNGAPGVRSSRFAHPDVGDRANRRKLLSLLSRPSPARFRTVVAFFDGGEIRLFDGILDGTVILEERGDGGFGYDPVFVPEGCDRTLAELSAQEKNALSHRKRALDKFAAFLNDRRRNQFAQIGADAHP